MTNPPTPAAQVPPGRERLGSVGSLGGELMIIDFGLLRFWSGDAPPHLEDGVVEPSLTEEINASGDHELVGSDAGRAAELLDMVAVNGTYVFDVPAEATAVAERLDEIRARHGLDVALRPIPRMPHRERVSRLLGQRPTGVEVSFFGNGAVAVGGLPPSRELPVFGERMSGDDDEGDDGDDDRWRSVWVEVEDGPVAASHEIGHVYVDEARLMFADPDVLSSWTTDESLDGRADLVFWGRDAESVAAELGAGRFDQDGQPVYGWMDRPVEEMEGYGRRLVERRHEGGARFAFDYRPHDDDHRLLSRMRDAATGAGTVDVGGTPVCGFFNSWGDGAFPVYVDLSGEGRLLRVRVDLGTPVIVERQRRLEELWFGDLSKAGVATRPVLDGSPVRWLERHAPYDDADSGWTFYAGTETEEEMTGSDTAGVIPLRDVIQRQPALEPLLDTPAPAAFAIGEDQAWHPVVPPPDD